MTPETAYKDGQQAAHGKNKSVTQSFFDSFDINNLDDAKSNSSSNNGMNYRENVNNKNGNHNSGNGGQKHGNDRARQEVEVRWTCPLCTYHNNMFMTQCELCGTLKPENPMTVQVKLCHLPIGIVD